MALVIVLAIVMIAIVVIAILCASGMLGRNPVVGIRIPSLFASDEAWKAGHRAAVMPITVGAVVCVAVVIASLLVPAAPAALEVAEVIVILAAVITGGVRANGAAHAVRARN